LDVVSVQQKIGLEKNDGSYGLLRNAAHKLEDNISSTKNITLTNQLLLLRRHEKDFMLRGDLKYVNAFDNRLNDVLKQLLLHEDLADTQTILLFEQYKKAFKQFVSLSQQKGLTDYQGMIGELRSTVKKTEVLLAEEASKLKRAINQARFKAEQFLLMLGIGIAFAISTLVFNIANRISARLQQVTTSMVDISKGDGDLSVVLDTKGDDEIAELGLAFNTFVGKIHYMVNIVSQSALQLVSTTEEMSVVMEQAKNGALKQQHDINLITASVEEMNVTVDEVMKNTNQARDAAIQARQEVYQGEEKTKLSIRGVELLSDEVGSAIEVIKKLVAHSQNIDQVLNVIQGIADQTNLLALNAAIEAARAGDSGKGFAVVADEVRTLALRTQEATKEILNITNGIQVDAEEATQVMEMSEAKAANAISQTKLTNMALLNIIEIVERVSDMNRQIVIATEQQSLTSNEIGNHMAEISTICEESTVGIKQLSMTNNDLINMTQELRVLVSQFKL
ncbi:methyl-accepting chemotaxis protein, partial [Photobacterium sp. OFAV2-7]|uniref:methyl-accepting chemotaxis protein n=1 Tax=Photobacterium sp. OFAV2-7 TaxID=2917748 RepID=UPI001EF59527